MVNGNMEKYISQDYFNSVVVENMELLSLSIEEALEETINQFKAQNVSLLKVIKTVDAVRGTNRISILAEGLEKPTNNTDVKIDLLEQFRTLLPKDPVYQILAGDIGIPSLILNLLEEHERDDFKIACIYSLSTLMDGYPDLLDIRCAEYIFRMLKECKTQNILIEILKWIKVCCVKHEKNRQTFMNGDIGEIMANMLTPEMNPELLCSVCNVTTALTLDDDIREVISQSHIHGSTLAVNLLPKYISIIEEFSNNENVLCELFPAISSLLIRNEFCSAAVNNDGFTTILRSCAKYSNNEKLQIRTFLLIDCLCRNEEVRSIALSVGAGTLIMQGMETHCMSDELHISAFKSLAIICLRNRKNSELLSSFGCLELILRYIQSRKTNIKVLSAGCRVLRNMVSCNSEVKKKLIDLEAEDFLQECINEKVKCVGDVRTLLKDMGCQVDLKEEWTGREGNKLSIS